MVQVWKHRVMLKLELCCMTWPSNPTKKAITSRYGARVWASNCSLIYRLANGISWQVAAHTIVPWTWISYQVLTQQTCVSNKQTRLVGNQFHKLILRYTGTHSGAEKSRLFRNIPRDVYDELLSEESTSNFHHWCLTPNNATLSGLDHFYQVLTTSPDDNGLTFVSSIEAKDYPIWGVQFHPEKNIFEWSSKYRSIPHSAAAVRAAQYFAEFFVNQGITCNSQCAIKIKQFSR